MTAPRPRRPLKRALAFALFALALCACTGTRPSLPLAFQLPAEEPEESTALSQRVLLIADNQQHYLYGEPVWLRRGLFDKAVGTAIRSPQLDLFGGDLLEWILANAEQTGKTVPIHLGDAANVSCEVELDRFAAHMRKSEKPWFMAPGNHDGFFYGTGRTLFDSAQMRDAWAKACRNGGGPLTTSDFIRRYLGLLAAQNDPGAQAFAREAGPTKDRGDWRYRGTGRALLRRVAWRFYPNGLEYWHSYVIQELDLTVPGSPRPVRALLIDTSQYDVEPSLVGHITPGLYDAGSTGSMRSDQLAHLESWLASNQREGAASIVMGHHPQGALEKVSRKKFQELRAKYDVQLYVSAHTHSGSYNVIEHEGAAQLELNIGSTLDFPAQYRTFQVSQVDGDNRLVVRSPRVELWRAWQQKTAPDKPNYPNCEAQSSAWYSSDASRNRYIEYMNDNTFASSVPMQRKIMRALLETYERLLRVAPTKAATTWPGGATDDASLAARIEAMKHDSVGLPEQESFLRALEAFEGEREVNDPAVHTQYRLCQAMWASGADLRRQRKPEEDQWFVVFPPRASPGAQ